MNSIAFGSSFEVPTQLVQRCGERKGDRRKERAKIGVTGGREGWVQAGDAEQEVESSKQ